MAGQRSVSAVEIGVCAGQSLGKVLCAGGSGFRVKKVE